jgi:PST family polysaccharide transporter
MQHNALLKRDLRFDLLATIEVAASVLALIAGIWLAYVWRNVWAIVAMNFVQTFVIAVGAIAATRWVPGRPRWLSGAGELFRFGANTSIYTLLNFFSRNSATLIIGHLIGPVSLGHFNRASALFQLPVNNLLQPIGQAALPVMTRFRPQPELYQKTYLGLVRRLSVALAPAAIILAFASDYLVVALLGPAWLRAGYALMMLSPALAVYGLLWPMTDLLISQNRSADLRTSGIWDVAFRAGGTLIGANFGMLGAAAGLSIGTIASLPVRIWQSGKTGPVTIGAQYQAALPAIPLGLGAIVGGTGGRYLVSLIGFDPIAATFLIGGLGAIGGLAGGLIVPAARQAVFDLVRTLTGRYEV